MQIEEILETRTGVDKNGNPYALSAVRVKFDPSDSCFLRVIGSSPCKIGDKFPVPVLMTEALKFPLRVGVVARA